MTENAEQTTSRVASHMEMIPEVVKQRVTSLQELQKQHDDLEKKFREERLTLILKYQELYEPLYLQRSTVINGSDESAAASSLLEEEPKGVPDFWLLAMKSNEIVAMQISQRDEAALKYLRDIKSFYTEEPKGFRLEFYFAENPYFTNSVLKKEYHMVDEDEPILERVHGTEIEWKEGKKLTVKLMKKKVKKNAPKDGPVETKLVDCESFFNFFSPPRIPEDDEDVDQDEAEELQDLMEQDYDIGATIRDKIVAHAVSWYTGEAVEDDVLEAIEEEEDEFTDSEEEDSEDEESKEQEA